MILSNVAKKYPIKELISLIIYNKNGVIEKMAPFLFAYLIILSYLCSIKLKQRDYEQKRVFIKQVE